MRSIPHSFLSAEDTFCHEKLEELSLGGEKTFFFVNSIVSAIFG